MLINLIGGMGPRNDMPPSCAHFESRADRHIWLFLGNGVTSGIDLAEWYDLADFFVKSNNTVSK